MEELIFMRNTNVTININNIFTITDRTLGEKRLFPTLQDAINAGKELNTNEVFGIVEMQLKDNEYCPVQWYERNGKLIEDDETFLSIYKIGDK